MMLYFFWVSSMCSFWVLCALFTPNVVSVMKNSKSKPNMKVSHHQVCLWPAIFFSFIPHLKLSLSKSLELNPDGLWNRNHLLKIFFNQTMLKNTQENQFYPWSLLAWINNVCFHKSPVASRIQILGTILSDSRILMLSGCLSKYFSFMALKGGENLLPSSVSKNSLVQVWLL